MGFLNSLKDPKCLSPTEFLGSFPFLKPGNTFLSPSLSPRENYPLTKVEGELILRNVINYNLKSLLIPTKSAHLDASYTHQFSSVQVSHIQLFVTPWTATCQASLSITNSLLKLVSIKSVMPSNHLILCHPLLLPPLIFPSIRVFSNESALCIRWPEHWSFSFSINPSNEYSGLISFRIDWFDLLAVQGTLKSFLQHHSSKASNLCAYIHAHRQLFSCYLLCFEF